MLFQSSTNLLGHMPQGALSPEQDHHARWPAFFPGTVDPGPHSSEQALGRKHRDRRHDVIYKRRQIPNASVLEGISDVHFSKDVTYKHFIIDFITHSYGNIFQVFLSDVFH